MHTYIQTYLHIHHDKAAYATSSHANCPSTFYIIYLGTSTNLLLCHHNSYQQFRQFMNLTELPQSNNLKIHSWKRTKFR
ncbi:hypothetical protein CDL12_23972 [Handroanthus impetiginosus]|uniref:Uncharacterized protein n=1 Tax=Handroanthus impetiginosus TaxID=429701 RepID=A0A2G9GEQ4_9LAMI|nr:hypothetical protein CDL12_23972 [Handroanthus impetiginosus]